MELVELFEQDKNLYDQFVAANQSGSFLQSWEWGEWQAFLGRAVSRFWILKSGEKIGSVQLIKMPLFGSRHYWYAPYGPVTEPKFESEHIKMFAQLLKVKFPDCIFIRIEPKNSTLVLDKKSFTKSTNIQPGRSLFVDLKKNIDQLLSEMHPKTRYNIKVAQKHGVEIQEEFGISVGHGLFVQEAVGLLVQTAKRQGYRGYKQGYYNKMVDFFTVQNRGNLKLHIYKAIYKNQLLSAAVMLDFGSVRTFLFGGSSERDKNVMAPYFMHFQAMEDAKKQGLSLYDFWGTETSLGGAPGFVRFKLGFGGEEKIYLGGYDILNQPIVYKVYKILKKMRGLIK